MRNYSILKLSLFPVFILFFLAGVTSTVAFAQSSNQTIVVKKSVSTTNGKVKVQKTVKVEDVNGEMEVIVTFIENGNKRIEIYRGEEAEKYLTQQQEVVVVKMEEMDINNMEFTFDVEGMQEGDGKKVIFITADSDVSGKEGVESTMFESFSVSQNPSNGKVEIAFNPINKGEVNVSILDGKGNVLFTDSYNGKGEYAKTISILGYNGVVMVKVAQGNEVEVRKLIIE